MHDNAKQRQVVLGELYQQLERTPKRGWVSRADLGALVSNIEFALAVLIEFKHIERQQHRYRITATGIIASEQQQGEDNA